MSTNLRECLPPLSFRALVDSKDEREASFQMSEEQPLQIKIGTNASESAFPETPHELPYNRARVDELLVRVRQGDTFDLLSEVLACVDWRLVFSDDSGNPLTTEEIARLHAYYRRKWSDIGTVYLAELLSTEFITE